MVKIEDRPMDMKKAVFKEIHQMESTVEVGQSTIDDRVKKSVFGSFYSCKSPFIFLVVFCL
jgi:hypothetical protein